MVSGGKYGYLQPGLPGVGRWPNVCQRGLVLNSKTFEMKRNELQL